MLTIDGKQLRNLEEQVEKNKQDIEYIINEQGSLNQFGIKVVGQIDILNNLPTVEAYKQSNPEWEYGDAYAVGVTSPYSLYILTRANGTHTEDYWFSIGQFPLQGAKGDAGDSSSIAVGTTTTLIEGSPARVENVGTTRDATLNFYIPRGDKGETGEAATITLGRVEKGTTAQITNSGDEHNAVFNFTLPQGDKGDKGDAGDSFQIVGTLDNIGQLPEPSRSIRHEAYIIPDSEGDNHLWGITGPDAGPLLWTDLGQITGVQGEAATIKVGTTTTLSAGQSATVSNVGTEQDAVFNFGIPKGADGVAASVKIGTVTTLPAGQMATVQNSGTTTNAVLNFGIPKGQDGDGVQPEEVALTPATATQGTLTDEQLLTLQSNKNNWITLNNELYRLNDEQTNSGYLVYSHEGQDSAKLFQLKAITITISTKGWVLMTFTPQSQLTFDTTPTENSLNPVTSGGVYNATKKRYLHTIHAQAQSNLPYRYKYVKFWFDIITDSGDKIDTLEKLLQLFDSLSGGSHSSNRFINADGFAYMPAIYADFQLGKVTRIICRKRYQDAYYSSIYATPIAKTVTITDEGTTNDKWESSELMLMKFKSNYSFDFRPSGLVEDYFTIIDSVIEI